jgi:hypothetical protein
MFHRVHRELVPRIGPSRSALAATLLAAILIVAPTVMLVSVIAHEAPQVIDYVQRMSLTAPHQIEQIWELARRRSPVPLPDDPAFLVREGVQRILAFLAPRAGAAVADLFATLGSLLVMLFAMFFLLLVALSEHLPLPALIASASDRHAISSGQRQPDCWWRRSGTIGGSRSLLGIEGGDLGNVWRSARRSIVGAAPLGTDRDLVAHPATSGAELFLCWLACSGSFADNVLRLLPSGRTISGLVVFSAARRRCAGFIGLVIRSCW